MEYLSKELQPYKDIVATTASVVTILQFFSGGIICKDIYKKGSTKGFSSIPFIGGIVVGVLVLKYAFMLEDNAMFQVNTAAIALNLLYAVFYYNYAENKWKDILKPASYGAAVIAIILGYSGWEHEDLVEFRYGLIVTILMLILMGSPLLELSDIVKKKDASSIPFPLVFMGTIVSFLWLLYGIILLNNFMIVQNGVGFILCFLQLFIYFKYPPKVESSSASGRKKKPVKAD